MASVNYTGLASGIDSTALIDALLQQKRTARITPLETKIADIQGTNDAFSELKTKLNALKDASAKFRLLNGGGVKRQASSSDETVLTAASSTAASDAIYGVTVSQLAKNGNASLGSANRTYASTAAAINPAINNLANTVDRTVSVAIGTGADAETVDVALTAETTLADFIADFNSQSTLATASAVNVGTEAVPSYVLSFTSKNAGTEKGTLAFTIGNEVLTAGNPGGGAFDQQTVSQATNARFTIDGISGTIERASNTINDVLPGVSFQLQHTGSATIDVKGDSESTASLIGEFVAAFNDVVQYLAENDTITQQKEGSEIKNIFGPLASTSIDDNALTSLRQALHSAKTNGGSLSVLADLGIATQRDGTLTFDEAAFTKALDKDSSGASSLLEQIGESLGATGGVVDQYTRYNGLIDAATFTNQTSASRLQTRIGDVEDQLSREQQSLTARFARLEALIGGMQRQQQALSGLLPA